MTLPEESDSLQIKAFETPWGTTNQRLCYRQREYPWPSTDTFKAAIFEILGQFPNLEVWCERDCDQSPVKRADSLEELLKYMELEMSFCESGLGECPSFSCYFI